MLNITKDGYYVCCDCLALMVIFDKSGCIVLYLFKMFNLGSGVWIPYRRGIIQVFIGLVHYRQFLLHQVCMVRWFV